MNTLALAHRICRYLTVNDVAELSVADSQHLIDAMNAGMFAFYENAPDHLRRTTFSTRLLGKITVSLSMSGGYDFADYTATDEQLGNTIKIEGDPSENEIVSPNSLLDYYRGGDGSRTAHIYGDVIGLPENIERIILPPSIDGEELLYCDQRLQRNARSRGEGRPCYYWHESTGFASGAGYASYLRVNPLPSTDYNVRFTAQVSSYQFSLGSLTTPENIPVRSDLIEAILVPLCLDTLLGSHLWSNERKDASLVANRISAAHTRLQNLSPYPVNIDRKIYTPKGW